MRRWFYRSMGCSGRYIRKQFLLRPRPLIGLWMVCLIACMWTVSVSQAQLPHSQQQYAGSGIASISRNGVSGLEMGGDTLWVAPGLDYTADHGSTWQQADVHAVRSGPARVFSMDVDGSFVWAGLGFPAESRERVASAAGFLFSTNGGQSWTQHSPPLDSSADTLIRYGNNDLRAIPVTSVSQSPPYSVDWEPSSATVWTAGWASGIRRSTDQGESWERVVLPPDTLAYLHPDSTYNFVYGPRSGTGQHTDNFLGFSVLVDETGTVWAGTAGGVNRSRDGVVWRHFRQEQTAGLVGNWTVKLAEQPRPNMRSSIWIASWRAVGPDERFGVSVTRDGGASFDSMLVGERVFDFAFRGDTVLAAASQGVFISEANGQVGTWERWTTFPGADDIPSLLNPRMRALAVATSRTSIWVGTDEGLLLSQDGGSTWSLFRTQVPVRPENPSERVPGVDAYAYPNPFSPVADGRVRIRYELSEAQSVEIHVFDFAMNRVATVFQGAEQPGTHEHVWDGTEQSNRLVANGTYFYVVKTGGDQFWGKILVAR